jgi:hypothetical protein
MKCWSTSPTHDAVSGQGTVAPSPQDVGLYDVLGHADPSPVIELNRAVATGPPALSAPGGTPQIAARQDGIDEPSPATGPVAHRHRAGNWGNHPEIIATADIGCYAYPRRETHVPVVHGAEHLV